MLCSALGKLFQQYKRSIMYLTNIKDLVKKKLRILPVQPIMAMNLLFFSLVLSLITLAQDKAETFDVLQSAQQALDTVIKEVTNGEYELPYELASQDEFDKAFMDFQNVLDGGNLEAMAKWFPTANELMTYLESTPALVPYADWLRQRLDYAAVANEAVNTIALAQPRPDTMPSQPGPQETGTGKSATRQSEPKPKPVATKSDGRLAFVRSADTWSKKMAGRPPVDTAAQFVPPLKKIFSAQGVPQELVWIAEVESTFNPAARSPAGAVGLFQLMPATAKHLGLKLEPEDQRLDPSHNGRAAAKYLKDLFNRFEDWPLAIAAYNGGEGRISKLLKANSAGNLEAITDQLPGQTQMYVPKVLATIRHREGFDPMTRW